MAFESSTLRWAKRHEDYGHLFNEGLRGWAWPLEHKRLVLRLKRDYPDRYKRLQGYILPPMPIEDRERLHPNLIA